MKPAAMVTVAVVLVATFGLSWAVVLNPIVPAAVAGCALFAVLLSGNPSWTVHGLLISAFAATTTSIPTGIRVGGYFVFFYEFFVFASLLYAINLWRASPRAWERLRSCLPVWVAISFAATTAMGIFIGILRGFSLDDIQTDVRPVLSMIVVALTATIVVLVDNWRRYIKTLAVVLWFSMALTLYASASGTSLGGRTETAQLYSAGGGVLSGGSDAIRYLTEATPLALAVLLACTALLLLGRTTPAQAAPLLLPSLVISFFSFSRNTIVALAVTVLFALVVALVSGKVLRLITRVAWAAAVAGVLIFGLVVVGRGLGAGNWIDTQVVGYANRVVAGFDQSTEANDSSTQYRRQENANITRAGAEHPILGGGFGYRYKPAEGERGDFEADRAQLYAHNTYGWFYVKVGVVGTMAFLALIATCLLPALHRRNAGPVLAGAAATLAGLAVAMTVTPLPIDHGTSTLLGLVVGACIGAVASRATRDDDLVGEQPLTVSSASSSPR